MAEFVGLVKGAAARRTSGGVGEECLGAAATHPEVRIVINAVVGGAGPGAPLAARRAGAPPRRGRRGPPPPPLDRAGAGRELGERRGGAGEKSHYRGGLEPSDV